MGDSRQTDGGALLASGALQTIENPVNSTSKKPVFKFPDAGLAVVTFDLQNNVQYLNRHAQILLEGPQTGKPLPESGNVRGLENLLVLMTEPGQTISSTIKISGRDMDALGTFDGNLKQIVFDVVPSLSAKARNIQSLDLAKIDVLVRQRTDALRRQNQELEKVKQRLEETYEEIEVELEMARKIQHSILPARLPQVSDYRFAVKYTPSGQVGGDFYNIVQLDEETLMVLEADVSGHGLSAAFVTTMAKAYFDRYVRGKSSLVQALRDINREFCGTIKTEHYLTAFLGLVDLPTGRMAYSRVCHPYPILYRKKTDTVEFLSARGGFFVGMMPDENDFKEESVTVDPGDRLLVYTDGLNEGFNAENAQYGRERLAGSVRRHSSLPVEDFLDNVIRDRNEFMKGNPDTDDITVVAMARLES